MTNCVGHDDNGTKLRPLIAYCFLRGENKRTTYIVHWRGFVNPAKLHDNLVNLIHEPTTSASKS